MPPCFFITYEIVRIEPSSQVESDILLFFRKKYAPHRADLGTFAAGDALAVIDNGKVVFHVDRIRRAGLFAFFAGDTAVCAFLANDCAFFFITANNYCFCICRNERDYSLGAGLYAKTATDAKLFVYPCNAVLNADGVLGTNRGAISATYTSIDAGFRAAVYKTFGLAAFNAFVDGFFFRGSVVSVAVNESRAAFNGICLDTEDGGNFLCHGCGTGNAEVGFRALLYDSFCIAVAACVAACAAVCTGKTFAYTANSLVAFNAHKVGGKSEKHRAYNADSGNDRHGCKNICYHIGTSLREQPVHNARKAEECKRNDGSGYKRYGQALEAFGRIAVFNS